jgi:pyruvate formate lyase activating enzyme
MDIDGILALPNVKMVPLQEKENGKVRCGVCEHRCSISEGKRGICGCRMNLNGNLYTITYGNISALESRPIEIKPFFNFWPGSTAMTFSTWGCNFKCPWCQNYNLSKNPPEPGEGAYLPPERIIDRAIRAGDSGICVSFNEPLMLFEYSLDLFPLAHGKKLYNTYVSNGYMTEDALGMLVKAGLDGLKIDIKGDEEAYKKHCGAREDIVWRNARLAKDLGVHVEMVNLVIPGVNDHTIDEVIQKHLDNVGPSTPIHFTRYHPDYEFTAPRTPEGTIREAVEKARELGTRYAYIGNVRNHKYENTWCPECDKLLIERDGFYVTGYYLKDGRCPYCDEEIEITGEGRVSG